MKKLIAIVFLFCLSASFISEKKPLTWMAIGDSITFLDGHPGESAKRTTLGYMARVVEKLPFISYTNHGHNGWTTARIAGAIETLNIAKADIYTVFLGTNDWWVAYPIGAMSDYRDSTGNKTVYGAYRIIINKIRRLNSEAKIILITPMQRGDFVHVKNFKNNAYGSYKDNKTGQHLSEYADAVKAIAGLEKLEVVDLYYKSGITPENAVKYKRLKDPQSGEYKNYTYPDYTSIPFNPATDEYPYPLDAVNMTFDGLHPSDKGLQIIADMLIKAMDNY